MLSPEQLPQNYVRCGHLADVSQKVSKYHMVDIKMKLWRISAIFAKMSDGEECSGWHCLTFCGLVMSYGLMGYVIIGSGKCLVQLVNKLIPGPTLTNHQLDSWEHTSKKFYSNPNICIPENIQCICKKQLQNVCSYVKPQIVNKLTHWGLVTHKHQWTVSALV